MWRDEKRNPDKNRKAKRIYTCSSEGDKKYKMWCMATDLESRLVEEADGCLNLWLVEEADGCLNLCVWRRYICE